MQTGRKYAQQDRTTGTAKTCLSNPEQYSRQQQQHETGCHATDDGGGAPHQGHQGCPDHPPVTIHQQRDRHGQHADRQCHDADQRTELGIRQSPQRLQERKYRSDDLPRHVVREHQPEDQGKHQPHVRPTQTWTRNRRLLARIVLSAQGLCFRCWVVVALRARRIVDQACICISSRTALSRSSVGVTFFDQAATRCRRRAWLPRSAVTP